MAPFCDKSSDFRFEWLFCDEAQLSDSNFCEFMLVMVLCEIEGLAICDWWRHCTPLHRIGELVGKKGCAKYPKNNRHAATKCCLVPSAALMKQAYLVSELIKRPYEFQHSLTIIIQFY